MKRKTIIIAAIATVCICGTTVVASSLNAFASNKKEVKPVVYSLDNREYSEIVNSLKEKSSLMTEEELVNNPLHNLSVDYTDDFSYERSTPVEYRLGDTEHAISYDAAKLDMHRLMEERGTAIPTYFGNLGNSPYQYTILEMRSRLYTDCYFNVSSNNSIEMSMGTLSAGGNNITITLYETGNNNAVMYWTGNPQSIQGLGWGPLNPFKTYYFKFSISSGFLSGSGMIHH